MSQRAVQPFVKSYLMSGQDFWLRNTSYCLKYLGVISWGKSDRCCIYSVCIQKGKFTMPTDVTLLSHVCGRQSWLSQNPTEFQCFYSTLAALTTKIRGQAWYSDGSVQSLWARCFYQRRHQHLHDWGRNVEAQIPWPAWDLKVIQCCRARHTPPNSS